MERKVSEMEEELKVSSLCVQLSELSELSEGRWVYFCLFHFCFKKHFFLTHKFVSKTHNVAISQGAGKSKEN